MPGNGRQTGHVFRDRSLHVLSPHAEGNSIPEQLIRRYGAPRVQQRQPELIHQKQVCGDQQDRLSVERDPLWVCQFYLRPASVELR